MRTQRLTIGAAVLALSGAALAQDNPPLKPLGQDQPAASRGMLVPVDWVLTSRVVGQDRERLGEISELIIAPARDRVDYALLEHGGLLGMGEHIIPVPWRSLEWDNMNRVLQLPVTSERMSSAPTIDKNDWANLGQPAWRTKVDDFFEGKSIREGAAKWQKIIRNGQPVTIRGTVRDVDTSEPVPGMGPDRIITIVADNGDVKVVHIGPAWFVDHQRQMVRAGQGVEVTGYSVDLGENRVVIVTKTINTPTGMYRLRDDQARPVWDLGPDADAPDTKDEDPSAIREADRGRLFGREPDLANEPALVRVTTLKSQRVFDGDNQEVGRINTVVFNPENGKLAYAVVTVGGFLGMGDTKYAIPWKYFEIDQQGRITASKIDKEMLRSAPKVETRNWSELQDEQFGKRVYQHFGVEPTWMTAPAAGEGAPPASKDQPRDFPDEFQQLFSQGEAVEVSGSVARLDPGQGGMVDLVVRSVSGERTVKLAPQTYLDKIGLDLKEGQRVTVHGRRVAAQGQRVIVARDVVVDGKRMDLRDEQGSPAWKTPR
jgi:sporulation protein YlmC with PRC-barrel domain